MKLFRRRSEGVAHALAAVVAVVVATLVTATAAQQTEDRPLPPSPCPDIFSYEGSTVDWDRWYGVVLVTTDTPLTGLRLDVWLSRPALALRHNWDGNVTTLDHKRFTILNLYKRIEPGPPKAVRIIVKFDEDEEIPVVRAIELNGRRICSSRINTYESSYLDNRQQPSQQPSSHSRPEYHQDELPLRRNPPLSDSNFDRSTPRGGYDGYDSHEQDYKNTVSKAPSSYDRDPVYERTTTRRPTYSDDKYSDDKYSYGADDEYHPPPPPPPPPTRHTEPTKGSVYNSEHDTYVKQKVNPQYETLPASRRPPVEEPPHSPPAHRKPSGGGPPKLHDDDVRRGEPTAPGRPVSPPQGQGQGHGHRNPVTAPAAPLTTQGPAPVYVHRKTPTETPTPSRKPTYEEPVRPIDDDHRRPSGETSARRPPGGQPLAHRPQHADPAIDVRLGPHPLSDENVSEGDAYETPSRRQPELPLRQPGTGSTNAVRQPAGHHKPGGGPPGLGGNSPPGQGGPVPGHNKGSASNNYNSNSNYNQNNNNHYNGDGNRGVQSSTRPSEPAPLRPVEDKQCGRTLSVTPLITYGQNTSRGQWPWHAALYQVKGTDLKYICGGTLVSLNYVVTAAHCVTRSTTGRAVDPDTIIAYLGKYHLHRWTNEEGVQQGKVAAIHVHPTYNTSDFRGDLSLLELSTPLSYSQYVRPVCIWGHEDIALGHIVNRDGYVVGWGYDEYGELTEELRMSTMPIVSEQICLRSYPEFFSRFSNERTYCGGYKNGTSACNGDSGGGMVLPRFHGDTKVWFLRGLVSVSVSRDDQRVCNTEHYVVFTDLAKYGDWMGNYLR